MTACKHCGDTEVHIVFDGPPGPEAGRFVEVECANGHGRDAGWWERRGKNWRLVIRMAS